MKKLLSIVLAFVMAFSMVATVSAETVKDITGGGLNPYPVALTVDVAARKSGTSDAYVAALTIPTADFSGGLGVDFVAELDMASVRGFFTNPYMTPIKSATDFNNGSVTSEIYVDITFNGATFGSYDITNSAVGALTDKLGAATNFSETARTLTGNTLRITYANSAITAGALDADIASHTATADTTSCLRDLKFTLNDIVQYAAAGTYGVTVSIGGETKITFNNSTGDTADDYVQRITYSGTDTCTIAEPTVVSSGGGAVTTTYTVKFNTNGGTKVDSESVARGDNVSAPTTEKEGYKFDGWYADSSLKTPYDFSKPVYGNITLYAKWVEEGTVDPGTDDGECDGNGAGCAIPHYGDIDADAWYHEDVDYVVGNGLMTGVEEGVFAPDVPLTRGMIVTILWRQEQSPVAETTSEFADLAESGYYADAVEWADANGIVLGYTDTMFAPDNNITREQLAAIMYRYAKFKGYDVSVGENTNILSYDDVDDVSDYAIEAMQYAVGSGLLTGRTESTLNPKELTTRAEAAAILHRFLTAER